MGVRVWVYWPARCLVGLLLPPFGGVGYWPALIALYWLVLLMVYLAPIGCVDTDYWRLTAHPGYLPLILVIYHSCKCSIIYLQIFGLYYLVV